MSERAVKHVGVEVKGAQQDGYSVVLGEEFFLDIARGRGEGLDLESGLLRLAHAHRPAQAGPRRQLGGRAGCGGGVEGVEEELGGHKLTFAVCDGYRTLPVRGKDNLYCGEKWVGLYYLSYSGHLVTGERK